MGTLRFTYPLRMSQTLSGSLRLRGLPLRESGIFFG